MDRHLNYVNLSLIALLSLFSQFIYAANEQPLAVAGVLDLRSWDLKQTGSVNLDGEWEFYWQQLLTPEDFNTSPSPNNKDFIYIPSKWNKGVNEQKELPEYGYATFKLKVLLGDNHKDLMFRFQRILSSHTLYINGELVKTVGTVGKSASDTHARVFTFVKSKDNASRDIELVIQVANFTFSEGGISNSIQLGPEENIRQLRERNIALALFCSGSLMIMGIYHLFVYFTRKQDISPLFFGLVCLNVAIRTLAVKEDYLWILFPDASFTAQVNVEYVTFFLGPLLFSLFIHSLFKPVFSKKVLFTVLVVTAVFLLATAVLPLSINSKILWIYQAFTLLVIFYAVFVLVVSAIKRYEGALIFLLGSSFLFFAIIHDLLHYAGYIRSAHAGEYGLIVFMFSQALLLSLKSSNAFLKNELLTAAYERFVPKEFLKQLGKKDIIDVQLGDCVSAEKMSILFSDIRSFTALSETMSPKQNFDFLNSYLKAMEPAITANNGVVDKFIGDAIMAIFPSNADDAVKAAIVMQRYLREYNAQRVEQQLPAIHIGIGINTGAMMLGTIGAENRMEGTVISDAVNLAARMEGMTKMYSASILISESTYQSLANPQDFHMRIADKVIVKGKSEPVLVWEVFSGDPEGIRQAKASSRILFQQGIEAHYTKQFDVAKPLFEKCLEIYAEDKVANIYTDRCKYYLLNGCPTDWNGVERLTSK